MYRSLCALLLKIELILIKFKKEGRKQTTMVVGVSGLGLHELVRWCRANNRVIGCDGISTNETGAITFVAFE